MVLYTVVSYVIYVVESRMQLISMFLSDFVCSALHRRAKGHYTEGAELIDEAVDMN